MQEVKAFSNGYLHGKKAPKRTKDFGTWISSRTIHVLHIPNNQPNIKRFQTLQVFKEHKSDVFTLITSVSLGANTTFLETHRPSILL